MEVSSFYDHFSTTQHKSGVHKRHLLILEWLKYFGLKNHHSVLEIGSGIGTVTGLLAGFLSSGKLIANDISPKSIEIAKNRLKHLNNISFTIGDITQTSFTEKFDVIVLPDVLEHISMELHFELFRYFNNILSEDGFIAIHIPNPYYIDWATKHRPEELQVIDQPLHISFMAENIHNSGFYISYLKSYAIWNNEPDYQIIQLRKNGSLTDYNRLPAEPLTFKIRIVNKIKAVFGQKIFKLPI